MDIKPLSETFVPKEDKKRNITPVSNNFVPNPNYNVTKPQQNSFPFEHLNYKMPTNSREMAEQVKYRYEQPNQYAMFKGNKFNPIPSVNPTATNAVERDLSTIAKAKDDGIIPNLSDTDKVVKSAMVKYSKTPNKNLSAIDMLNDSKDWDAEVRLTPDGIVMNAKGFLENPTNFKNLLGRDKGDFLDYMAFEKSTNSSKNSKVGQAIENAYDKRLDFLTNDESKEIIYIAETQGKEKAWDKLVSLKDALGARKKGNLAQEYTEDYQNTNTAGKIGYQTLAFFDSVFGTIPRSLDWVTHSAGGDYDAYSDEQVGGIMSDIVRQTGVENVTSGIENETLKKFAKNGLMGIISVGDSMAAVGLSTLMGAPNLGLAVIASKAGQQKAAEMYERGFTQEQIALGSGAAAAIEFFTEKIGVEKIFDAFKKGTISSLLTAAGAEGGEEGLSFLGNKISEAIIEGSKSIDAQRYNELIESGKTPEEAFKELLIDNASEMWWQIYGGAVGGLFGGGSGTITNKINVAAVDGKLTKQIKKVGNGKAILDAALNSGDAKIVKAAEKGNVGKSYRLMQEHLHKKVADGYVEAVKNTGDVPTHIAQAIVDMAQLKETNLKSTILNDSLYSKIYTELKWGLQDMQQTDDGIKTTVQWVEDAANQTEPYTAASQIIGLSTMVKAQNPEGLSELMKYAEGKVPFEDISAEDGQNGFGFDKGGYTPNQATISRIGKAYGTKIVFQNLDQTINGQLFSPNGKYDRATNTLYINTSNAIKHNPIMFVLKHEMTHRLEMNPEKYADLQNAILESGEFQRYVLRKGFKTAKEYQQHLLELYTNSGVRYDNLSQAEDSINCEMTANFVGDVLFGGSYELTENFYKSLEPKHRRTFTEFIQDLLAKLKSVFAGNKAKLDEVTQLENMFLEVASKVSNDSRAEGERFSIAGEKAATSNSKSLEQAKRMEDIALQKSKNKKLSREESEAIRKETGWFKGYDNQWRFEIDDSKFKIKPTDITSGDTKIGDVMEHPELFKAYPELKDIVISARPMLFMGGAEGWYDGDKKEIVLSSKFLEDTAANEELKKLEKTPEYKEHHRLLEEISKERGEKRVKLAKEFVEIKNSKEYAEYCNEYDIADENDEPVEEIFNKWNNSKTGKRFNEIQAELEALREDNAIDREIERFKKTEIGKKYADINRNSEHKDIVNDESTKRTIIHELQHAIQRIENHTVGANPEFYETVDRTAYEIKAMKKAVAEYNEAFEAIDDEYGLDAASSIEEYIEYEQDWFDAETAEEASLSQKAMEEIEATAEKEGYADLLDIGIKALHKQEAIEKQVANRKSKSSKEQYRQTAGEIESRDTEKRLNYSPEERKANRPDIDQSEVYFSDDNVQFSLAEPVEETRDLIAIHNLNEQNFFEYLRLGGMPASSLAITKAIFGHTEFGTTSFMFYKNTIDPKKNKLNKLYGSDAWTPAQLQLKKNAKFDKAKTTETVNKLKEDSDGLFDLTTEEFEKAITDADGNVYHAFAQDLGMQGAYLKGKGLLKGEITEDACDTLLDKDSEWRAYKQWLNKMSDTIITSYDKADINDVIGNMRKQPATAKRFKLSPTGELTVPAVEYDSIEEMKKHKDRLSKDAAKATKEVAKEFLDFAKKIGDFNSIGIEPIVSIINKAYDNRYETSDIIKAFDKAGVKISEKSAAALQNLYKKAVELPTDYFEGKPGRNIPFSEIAFAVIPNDSSQEYKDALRSVGIEYIEYEAGNAQDRVEKMNSFKDTRFSIPEPTPTEIKAKAEEAFKDSKVRDENGELKEMYHGTSYYGFTIFNTYGSKFGLFGLGSYFTDNKSVAKSYQDKGDGGYKGTYSVYLNIENPLDMDAKADKSKWLEAVDNDKSYLADVETNEDVFNALKQYCIDNEMPKFDAEDYIRGVMEGMGYDGITHIGGGRYGDKDGVKHRVYIAFHPEQIKSSIPIDDNTGHPIPLEERFDKTTGDFRYSIPEQMNTEYMNAVENDDTQKAEKLVEKAAKDWGAIEKDGKPLVLYHGTPNGTFNKFKKWQYFTPNKEYADVYQNQGASSNGYKATATNPKTYSVYLNSEKVFDTRNPKEKKIFENEFYRKWGNGAPLSEKSLPDWTDGDDLIDFFEENGYDYDVMVLDEGATGGYGDEVKSRGISYVAKNPNQIKSADTVTYDDKGNVIPLSERFSEDEDIRYSVTENPMQIASHTQEDVDTTNVKGEKKKPLKSTDSTRKTYGSMLGSEIITDEVKNEIKKDEFVKNYESITNKGTLKTAMDELEEKGQARVQDFFKLKPERANAVDVAVGVIMMERYQRAGKTQEAVNVAEKLAEIGTVAGQTVQAFSIIGRLAPDAMVAYAQKDLNKAFEILIEKKTKKWIDANKEDFKLTNEDIEFIRRRTLQAAKLPDGSRQKAILLSEISQRVQNKIPPDAAQSIRAFQRISLLLNPKTLLRNVVSNVGMTPVFIASDFFGNLIDKGISKKTGIRTTGNVNLKEATKGFKKGAWETLDDFKRGVQTKIDEINRFEIKKQGGKNFNENTKSKQLNAIARKLNQLDDLTSFGLEIGDRPFFEMWYMNSLNNQLRLNNVDMPTTEMMDVARTEAMQRTWQDTNTFTRSVSNIKKSLNNMIRIPGTDYGLGDAVIKFVKTPANLAKAIYEFSPVGVASAAANSKKLADAIQKGTATPQMQKEVVKSWGNAITGTVIYSIIAMAVASGLAKLKGRADDDKDVREFEKNVLGLPEYSIEMFGQNVTYDWNQPFGSVLAIIADIADSKKDGEDKGLANDLWSAVKVGGEVFSRQSFLRSLEQLFSGEDFVSGLVNSLLAEPSAFIPSLLSQTGSLIDKNRRTSYVKGEPITTAINKILTRIPGIRAKLPKQVNVLGEDVKNPDYLNAFNSYFNIANKYPESESKEAKEVYKVFKKTGDKAVIPPKAPDYITVKGERIDFVGEDKAEYQRKIGQTSTSILNEMFKTEKYKKLSAEEKAEAIKKVYAYSNKIGKVMPYSYETLHAMESALTKEMYKKLSDKGKKQVAWEYFLTKKEEACKNDSKSLANLFLQ